MLSDKGRLDTFLHFPGIKWKIGVPAFNVATRATIVSIEQSAKMPTNYLAPYTELAQPVRPTVQFTVFLAIHDLKVVGWEKGGARRTVR